MLLSLVLGLLPALVAPADEIFLKNGDRISGKIVSMADGKLVVDTGGNAGSVTIAWKEIKTINSEAPVKVVLKDGTTVERLLGSTDGGAVMLKGGDVVLPAIKLEEFDKLNPPPTDSKWEGNINIGASKTVGNTEAQQVSAGAEFVRRSLIDRFTVTANWFYAQQENTVADPNNPPPATIKIKQISDRKTSAALKYDYFISKKWYLNANTKAENSLAANLELRYTIGGGLGYQITETDDCKVSVEAGLVYFREQFRGDPSAVPPIPNSSNDFVSARIANNVEATPLTGITYLHLFEWYPSIENSRDSLIHYDGKLRMTLTESMFAQFNLIWDWDNTPAVGKRRNDEKYILAVGWKI